MASKVNLRFPLTVAWEATMVRSRCFGFCLSQMAGKTLTVGFLATDSNPAKPTILDITAPPDVAKRGVVTYEGMTLGASEPQLLELGESPCGVNSGFLPQPALVDLTCPTRGRGPVFKFSLMSGKR